MKKGNVSPMMLVVLAAALMVGIYIISSVYSETSSGAIPVANQSLSLINSTYSISLFGFNLMSIGIVVGAAVFVLLLLGGKG